MKNVSCSEKPCRSKETNTEERKKFISERITRVVRTEKNAAYRRNAHSGRSSGTKATPDAADEDWKAYFWRSV